MNYFEVYMNLIKRKKKKAVKINKKKGTLKKTKSPVDEKPEYEVGKAGKKMKRGGPDKKAVSVKGAK